MNIKTIIEFVVVINALLILYYLFTEKKNYRSMLYWTLFFIFFPLVGFVVYLIIGRGITLPFYYSKESEDNLTLYNRVKYFVDGKELFSEIINDIKKAKSSIHIESYIFQDDDFTKDFVKILVAKQKEGINVRIIFDPNGNFHDTKRQFKELVEAGGEIIPFYKGIYRFLNFNYRNHKKIIVIDGLIGYLGGFNIGKEYLSLHPYISPWRDSHIQIKGEAVYYLQKEFIKDYSSVSKNKNLSKFDLINNKTSVYCPISIVSFFPNANYQLIKQTYMKEIYKATKCIVIQTPYFAPDIGLLNALRFQLRNNVKVMIMIPKVFDKFIPYLTTLQYAKEMYHEGAIVYFYDGFIHAKTMIVDDNFLSIGSSNFDVRSFHHNLELNAFIYELGKVEEYKKIFDKDVDNSTVLDNDYLKREPKKYKIGAKLAKILSSLM